ncbi:MAG: GEVED domain-containing protein [Acidobacteriota bacterium]
MKRWISILIVSLALPTAAAAQTIDGTVFRDYNANGTCDSTGGSCDGSLEPGIAGVRVDAFDASGAAAGDSPRITAADGSFTLTGVSGSVRLEFTLPSGGGLDFLAPGAAGPSTVAFASGGDTVEVGFNNPADFCPTNPRFVVSCFTNGDPMHPSNVAEPVIVSFEYDDEGDDTSINRDKQTEVAQAALGPVWGLAYDRDRQFLYSAALLKRHVGLGPGGIGAIYRTNLATGVTDASPFFDFGASAGSVLDNATRFSMPAGSGSTPDRFGDNIDPSTFGQAATVGFGDLELSEDGATLFVTNLADRTVYRLNTSGTVSASAIPGAPWLATNPGGGTARAWGLDVQDGLLYVGVVSDAAPLAFQVYIWDGTAWSTAFASPVPLTYQRQLSDRTPDATDFWRPWTFTYTGSEVDTNASATPANIDYAIPQAILADLEVEPGGIMTLGFMDRGGLQYGYETPEPDDTSAGDIDISYWPAGDTLRATRSGANWVIENGVGGSGANPFGPGGREFFDDLPDWVAGDQAAFFSHDVGAGGLLMRKGSGEVAATSSDQVRPFSGSMAFFDLADGSSDRSLEVFLDTTSTDFSKAGGLGDMELLCPPAPIQVGNRVWCDDVNRNGIQDPGEAGINGVTVRLDCGADGSATAMTSGDGNYLFSALGANPIPPGAICTLSIDPSTMPGFPSGCVDPAFANVGSPSDPGSDLRDNDGVPMASQVEVPVTVGGPGANDHSYDFGFRTPPQPLLTAVKTDAIPVGGDGDGDGMLDGGDTLKYTVTITNNGDGVATAANFASSIDASTSLVVGSVMTSQGTVTTGNTAGDSSIAIDLGDVAAGGTTVTVMYEVTLANPIPDGVTEVVCQGSLTSTNHPPVSTDDPDTPDSTDSTDTPVDAAPEVSASKIDALQVDGDFDGRADAGDTIRYTVEVRNDGDASALATVFTTAVDASTSLVVGSVTTSQGTVTTGNTAGDTSVAVDIGTLAGAGSSVTITFDAVVDSPLPAGASEATCQGSVTGSNIPTTPTDDPDDPTGSTDPTDTPLDLGEDFGDAPDSYTTTASPSHRLDGTTGIYLGACVDSESAGQPAPAGTAADGDDANDAGSPAAVLGTCSGNDDEDGVTFDTMIIACAMAQVTVASAGGGSLNAWIDFDRDGQFDHPAERIVDDRTLTGSDTIQFMVPCSATAGATYARFRVDSEGGLTPTGSADNGEVEDYQVTLKGVDLGDAPDSYGTTAGVGGASHGVDATSPLYLGACVDTEMDGQPATAGDPASGDDGGAGTATVGTCAVTNDDEDGVTFDSMVIACASSNLTVTANAAGILDGWLDFDADGAFQADERIFSGQALAAGSNALSFNVPCDAESGTTYARFRLSSSGIASPTGSAMDGEVEDYDVTTKGIDLGDAPDSYGTTLGASGAQHAVDPATPLYLGACVDTESDGQPATAGDPADGDDNNAGLSTIGTCVGNDDEDGVTFDSMIAACGSADITVTASQSGQLHAWLDFDGDGVFQADEQIFDNQAVPAGSFNLSFGVPCETESGNTYARFRISNSSSLGPTGPAMDGEVEDYDVTTKGIDLGDAPDSYGTTMAAGGAQHAVDPATPLYLGACVDTESDGQPAATAGDSANGDDSNAGLSELGTCAGNDDEDGVTFDSMVIACGSTDLTVVASQAGLLDAWLDFDGDGAFQGDEQIFANQALAPGTTPLSFDVPCEVVSGVTYARFRASSAGGLGPDGVAMDGEVEDYDVTAKGLDLGDAPDSYGTTVAANGPRHAVDPATALYLGACVDTESDGQPVGSGADGDDLGIGTSTLGTCSGNDDEDGIVFDSMVITCASADLTVTAAASGRLDAWIDFDTDGVFQPDEQVFSDQAVAAGGTPLTFDVPCDATVGDTYARFRLSSVGGLGPQGPAMDGEIEDYRISVKGIDLGDAPAPYPTTLGDDGARHVVLATGNPTLGVAVDTEPDGVPSTSHMGDDLAGTDDEDGVSNPGVVVPGTDATVTLTGGATGGLVDAWIDFNADGDWSDPGEQIATSVALAAGASLDLTFAVPPGSPMGETCSRFRISSAGGLTPTGLAMDGEIEDYPIAIGVEDPVIGIAQEVKSLERTEGVLHEITFEIKVDNFGNVPLTTVQVDSELADCLSEAVGYTVLEVSSDDLTVNGAFDGDGDPRILSGSDAIEVGESGSVLVSFELDPGNNSGPYACSSIGTASSPEGTEVMDVSQEGPESDPDVNGDPRDNDEPTTFGVTISVLEIPTVGEVGLFLLASLLLLAGCGLLRRRASDL